MSPGRRRLLATLAGAGALAAPAAGRAQLRGLLADPAGPVFDDGHQSTGPLALEPGVESAVFRGLLNGTPVRVLLDSGAGLSVVDVTLARRLRLRGAEALDVRDTAGLPTGGVQLRDVSLRLPGLTFLDLATVALDLSALAATGQEVPMILGAEAFTQLAVALDRAAGTVTLSTRAAAAPPAGATALDLLPPGGRTRSLPLEVEGVRGLRAQFDLGSQSPLSASLAFARARGWLEGRRVSTWAAASVSGVVVEQVTTLTGLRLGGVALPPVPVELLDRWEAPETPLLAGYPLLSRFRLLADFAEDRLWLAAGPQAKAPFRRDRAGLVLRPVAGGEAWQVVYVALGSPAERADWRAGQVITAVRDAAGRPLGAGWGSGPAGETVRLRTDDGRERTLTLADYA